MNQSNSERISVSPETTPYVSTLPETDQDINMSDFNALDLGEEEPSAPLSEVAPSVNKDEVDTGMVNTTPIDDEEENLVFLYQQKINNLMKQQLATDDLDQVIKIRELINQLKLTILQLKNNQKKETDNTRNVTNNKISNKIIDIPYFQLVDDPTATKSENRPSYDNAEMFVSTFEMILETNDVNINKYWKKYLPKAFLFSKNEKHHRWYTNNINPLNEATQWREIKEKLIDRFGNSANTASNIERYLDLKQGQNETIRDYVDRYLETYRRLPNNKQPSDAIEAMKFLKSLLPRNREEVTNSLKKNKHHEAESYLPASLFELFRYLQKNIGDIQEALYLTVTSSTNNSKYSNKNYNNTDGYENKKRTLSNQDEDQMNKKQKDTKNLCLYCKKEKFSYEHLKSCIKYLQSDKYQQFLIKAAGKKEPGNK